MSRQKCPHCYLRWYVEWYVVDGKRQPVKVYLPCEKCQAEWDYARADAPVVVEARRCRT